MTQKMSQGLVENSIQEPCVGFVCVKEGIYCIVLNPTLLLIALCAFPHIRNIHVLVLFMSLVVTVTYARTSSLTHQYKHPRRLRKAVNYNHDIPAGNSFQRGGKGALWVLNTISPMSCPLSLSLAFP